MSDETKTQMAFSRQETLKMYFEMRHKYNRLLRLAREHVPAQLLFDFELEKDDAKRTL